MKDYQKLIAEKEAELKALKEEAAKAESGEADFEDLFGTLLGLNIAKAVVESVLTVGSMLADKEEDDEEDADSEEKVPEKREACSKCAAKEAECDKDVEDADESAEEEEECEDDDLCGEGICVDVSSLIDDWRGRIRHIRELTTQMEAQLDELDAFIDACKGDDEEDEEEPEEDSKEGKEEQPGEKPVGPDPADLVARALAAIFSGVQVKKSDKPE